MDFTTIILALNALLICTSSAYAQRARPVSSVSTPTPAPAPTPSREYVNLTYLLNVAGQYHTFLNDLISTSTLKTLQDQANNTDEGITIFVPNDNAFTSQKKPSLTALKPDQLKSLLLSHALPKFYTLADFKNLSRMNPVPTLAGQQYALNFTDEEGTTHISSGWTNTKIISSVHSTPDVAIYAISKVLLPEQIFGTDIPPTPAPAPAPDTTPPADAPSENAKAASSPGSSAASSPSSSHGSVTWSACSYLTMSASGVAVYFLL